MVAWNGQFFHGRLLSNEGLRSADIEKVLPKVPMTAAEKRAERDEQMTRAVLAMGGTIVRLSEAS